MKIDVTTDDFHLSVSSAARRIGGGLGGHSGIQEDVRHLIQVCHGLAAERGWWLNPATGEPVDREMGELLMLCVSEISEAMEGARKSKPGHIMLDDKLPHRPMIEVELADCVIRLADLAGGKRLNMVPEYAVSDMEVVQADFDVFPRNVPAALFVVVRDLASSAMPSVRVARALVRCLVLGQALGLDVPGAVAEKLVFNHSRPDHDLKNRAAVGGKSF